MAPQPPISRIFLSILGKWLSEKIDRRSSPKRREPEPLWRLALGANKPLLGTVLLTIALQMVNICESFLSPIFKTSSITMTELALCLAAASVVWVVVMLEKTWRRSFVDSATDIAVDTP